jgi:hypothetical protein
MAASFCGVAGSNSLLIGIIPIPDLSAGAPSTRTDAITKKIAV